MIRKLAPLLWFATFTVLLILGGLSWYAFDRYERGMLPDWAEAIVMAENPYNGIYMLDPAMADQEPLQEQIAIAQERGFEPPRMIIDRYTVRIFKHLPNTATTPNSAEICRDGTTMRMYFSRRISGYCRSEDFGEDVSFILEANGDGRLTCVDCNANAFPLHWVRVGDLP